MKKINAIRMFAGTVLATALLGGAAAASAAVVSEQALDRVQYGETQDQVIAQLGTPGRIMNWPLTHTTTLYYSTNDTADFTTTVAHVDIGQDGRVTGTDVSLDY